ncbi:histidine phosphatase family protein [Gordonia malaquae]|jgi:broad specificity phosphatase PhoE|uniref:Putative phosphoglycerate mutase n=1 Tax=Gordonia malaquae NBRC 108250 TaxID=1223542 RepID=M3VAX3_GORML|nr:histidine phosphatase family protein [Gordonia malaquae]GAC79263.1 putative phosphoglycerate mutase [Gordonia malaquae NBRC 108250]SEE36079.1 probable phosphoglycerate mutase [Gordonia malaquae]
MARLHLVRHGETTSNVMKILDTALPGASLTDFGARQGVRFGLDNPDGRGAVLAHSVANRARQTADMIASAWDGDTVAVDGVHEIQVGDFEGRSDREAHEVFHDVVTRWHNGDIDARLPGGESLEMLRDRYLPTVDDLTERFIVGEDRDVYLVSHGAAIRLIAAHLSQIDPQFAMENYLPNTGSVDLEYRDGLWVVQRWGSADLPTPGAVVDPMG